MKMRTLMKRLLSGILGVLMFLSIPGGQLSRIAAQSRVPTLLQAERLTDLPEGNIVYFGTASATLDEADSYYAVAIYRDGDLSQSASVQVRALDMTALYDKDYELYMYGVKVSGGDRTLLQTYLQGTDVPAQESQTDPIVVVPEASSNDSGKLAQLKEEATGQSTRDTYETDSEDLVSSIAQSFFPETVDQIPHAATLEVEFAPGEDEKWITFRLLDDDQSEGTENFTLTLEDAQGAEAYLVTNFSVSITDDEPMVHSTVSFTEARYDSSKGIATVTVERTGAEYSLVDMRIYTSEDTAKADVNYDALDATLSFMPYETKKSIEFYVGGEGCFSVLLGDFKACQPGRYTRTKVYISPEDSGPKLMDDSGSKAKTFTITLPGDNGDKQYTVEYYPGEPTGRIMDTSYTPWLEVGCYYFALSSEKGGYFHYSTSQYSGTDPGWKGTLTCKYVETDNQHTSYGLVEYYHSTFWKTGKVWAYGDVVMPGVYYQYVTADWETTSDFGNYQRYRLNSNTLDMNDSITKHAKFSRTQSNVCLKLLNLGNTNYNKKFHVSVDAYDSTDDYTPKCYLRFYGAVAMYKSYKISINEPTAMSYLTGTGGTVSNVPMQVSVKCGAQTLQPGDSRFIYANPDVKQSNMVFSLNTSTVNGATDKFGVLTGYTIAIDPGDSDKRVTKNYPEDFISYLEKSKDTSGKVSNYSATAVENEKKRVLANLDTIPYDSYFIDWIDSLQKQVVDSGLGYYQNLVFTPKFEYVDVTVEVREPDIVGATGSFTDSQLSTPGTYTYHAGDVLDLSAVCATAGYRVVGYEYSVDGDITSDIVSSTDKLLLLPKYSHYIIRPVLAENNNCIELIFDGTTSNVLGVNGQGVISETTGSVTRYYLNLNPQGTTTTQKISPEVGQIYSVCFKTYTKDNKLYVPVITDANGKVYTTQRYDFVASQRAINNVLKLTYVERDSLQSYTLTGNLVSQFPSILSTGLAANRLGVGNFVVSLPGKETTSNGITLIESVSDRTTDTGKFTLSNVLGSSGDRITMLISNGGSTTITEVVLGSVTQQDVGEVVMSYPGDAPYVSSLQYSYQSPTNNTSIDNNDNSVRIIDDAFIITVVVNDMGHDISRAHFTTYTLNAKGGEITSKPYVAVADPNNPGVYTVKIPKMTENLYNGHRIRVSLIEGDPEADHIEYPAVDTGLVFYVENVLLVEQTYDTSATPTVNIPMLGSANASASSGLLSFSRTDWEGKTGYTLSINVDAVAGTTTLSSQEKKQKYDQLNASAKAAHDSKKEAAATNQKLNDLETSAGYIISAIDENRLDTDSLVNILNSVEAQKREAKSQLDRINETGRQAKNAVSGYSDVYALKVDILILIAFDFVYNPETEEYVFCSGSVSLGGSVSYSKSIYFVVYGVPLYLNITGFLQADLTVYYPHDGVPETTAAQFESYAGNIAKRMGEVDAYLTVLLNLKASIGVGMCNVIGAGGSLAFKMQFCIPFASDDYGVLFSATGSVYVDLLVGRFNVDLGSATLGMGKYEGKSGFDFIGENLILSSAQQSAAENTSGMQNYGAGTADMSVFGYNDLIQATPEEVQRTVLLSDAAERTAPQIIELDDGRKMIFFIGNRGTGDSLSNRTLFWSVYENGKWSVPQIVADDGTFDASPTVVQKNGKVVVAWVDADGTASGESTTVEKLNSLGISAAVFKDGEMGQEITLVQDEFFNCAPQLNLDGDTLYCSYMKRDISEVTSEEGLLDMTGTYSTMAYVSYHIPSRTAQNEQFIVISHPTLTDPLVTDYHCVTTTMGGESYMLATYTVDEDGNLNSGEDRELFLSITNLTTGTTYYSIQLTSDQSNQALPKLTQLDGIVYLSWMENGSVFHLLDVSEILEAFFHADPVGDVYRNSTGPGWYRKSAADLPNLSDITYEGSFYDLASRDLFYDYAVDLHPEDKSSISISNYILATNGDDLYLFFTDFGSEDPDDLSMELYGLQYQRDVADDGVDENWGFGLPVQITDYGKVIDEFDLYMTKDNQISLVSNHYSQWIDSNGVTQQGANQLIQIEFDTKSSLSILGDVELPDRLVAGEPSSVTFHVINDGLMDANGFDVTVLQISGGVEQTVFSDSFDTTLGSGESCQVEIPWTVPADVSDTQIKVIVTEHDVAISKPAEAVVTVPYRSVLVISELTVEQENGTHYVSATVTNMGNADAPACTARTGIADGTTLIKPYAETGLPALASGESVQIRLPFTPELEDFSEIGIIELALQAVSGEDVLTAGYTKLASSQPLVVQINDGADGLTVSIGAQTTLVTQVAPWGQIAGDVYYTSSDATVACVDSYGTVYGASEGTATITAYYPAFGISDTIEITVTQNSNNPGSPETGDTTALWLWLLPMLLSSAAVLLLIQKKRAFQ